MICRYSFSIIRHYICPMDNRLKALLRLMVFFKSSISVRLERRTDSKLTTVEGLATLPLEKNISAISTRKPFSCFRISFPFTPINLSLTSLPLLMANVRHKNLLQPERFSYSLLETPKFCNHLTKSSNIQLRLHCTSKCWNIRQCWRNVAKMAIY